MGSRESNCSTYPVYRLRYSCVGFIPLKSIWREMSRGQKVQQGVSLGKTPPIGNKPFTQFHIPTHLPLGVSGGFAAGEEVQQRGLAWDSVDG